jgi:MFS family permease
VVTNFIVASTVSAPLYGKLSDLYGRKLAFIASISIFLAGSALCGFAASMGELIAFRTVQGLGAGGLIVLAQTVIGDLVSPRERGRYQGMFAAVFAACSVARPLLGGSPNMPGFRRPCWDWPPSLSGHSWLWRSWSGERPSRSCLPSCSAIPSSWWRRP